MDNPCHTPNRPWLFMESFWNSIFCSTDGIFRSSLLAWRGMAADGEAADSKFNLYFGDYIFRKMNKFESLGQSAVVIMGVRRGVSKRVEDGCRPPALQVGLP
jgi:hypothetical protein